MSPDPAQLTGAYAVNALSGSEREWFERHLAECAECQREVRELRETAAVLGEVDVAEPDPRLKARVLAEIRETPQERLPRIAPARPRPRRAAATRLLAAAAVLGVVLAGVFGVQAWRAQQQMTAMQQRVEQGAAISEVMSAPDARMHNGSGGGVRATSVVSTELNKAVFLPNSVPALAPARTYQLWFMLPGGPVSAGLLPGGHADPMVLPMPPSAAAMAVTDEPAGGSAQPTTSPLLTMPTTT